MNQIEKQINTIRLTQRRRDVFNKMARDLHRRSLLQDLVPIAFIMVNRNGTGVKAFVCGIPEFSSFQNNHQIKYTQIF